MVRQIHPFRNFSTNSAETGTATPNRETDYAAFGLGRIVTLEITSPSNLAGTTSAQIIDRWNHTGSTAGPTTDPLKDYRFRFGPAPTRANGATGNEGFTRQLVSSGGALSDPNANPTVLNNIINNGYSSVNILIKLYHKIIESEIDVGLLASLEVFIEILDCAGIN